MDRPLSRGPELRLLPLAAALIVIGTAVPIELRAPVWSLGRFQPSDFAVNIALFLPFGCALWRRSMTQVALLAIAVSALVELVQIWSFGRFPSFFDLAANAIGALTGSMLARQYARGRQRGPEAVPLGRAANAIACGIAAMLLVLWAIPPLPSHLSQWDRGYEMLVGNERSGDRPWRGTIAYLALVPWALSSRDVREALDLTNPKVKAALELHGAHVFTTPLSLRGGEAHRLRATAADAFAREAMASGEFTVLARFSTADEIQYGPARLISNSRDTLSRNFDLGQEGRELVFRVRTPSTGPNANDPRAQTRPILEAGREITVAAVFDGAIARIFVDGEPHARSNLRAAGCTIPALCDQHLLLACSVLGGCLALVALASVRPSRHSASVAISILAGAGGALALHLSAANLATHAGSQWMEFMALAGAGVVAAAWRPPREGANLTC